jgi:2-oxoglutarate dehydrogenase E1 component
MQESVMQRMWNSAHLSGGNAAYVEELYELYLHDPNAVPEEWRNYFQTLPADGSTATDVSHSTVRDHFVLLGKNQRRAQPVSAGSVSSEHEKKQVEVLRLIQAFRMRGHQGAQLDPLGLWKRTAPADLSINHYGLTDADLDTTFRAGDLFIGKEEASLREIVEALQKTYCRTIGAEFTHIVDSNQRNWFMQRLESVRGRPAYSADIQSHLLERVTAAEGLEKYLGTKYPGTKRFGLEGGESLIPMLDELIQRSGSYGTKEIVIGMAHRGRLNVLVNTFGKNPRELFDEFEGKKKVELGSGDVKYHQGFSSNVMTTGGEVHLAMAFNPSHLEIVSPVVEGSVRARQDRRNDTTGEKVLPISIHGDAAFAGQGVVLETFQMSQTRGFKTGGTIHIVINNQVGFTISNPLDARSTEYATDVAKMIQAPILHVNGDDPEAVMFVTQLAIDYRMQFKRDVVIDLVCYRRRGHNEADEPSGTQPLMYQQIAKQRTTRELYADHLAQGGVWRSGSGQSRRVPQRAGQRHARSEEPGQRAEQRVVRRLASVSGPRLDCASRHSLRPQDLAGTVGQADGNCRKASWFSARLPKIYEDRQKMQAGGLPINWGYAETMAYATLAFEGHPIRITGQDVGRGTFSHRHAVLHNQKDAGTYVPLQNLYAGQPRFDLYDSFLSEEAVLAFEYGYSTTTPNALVIWEAQFGDFANGAQVVIDQFITSGEHKWGRLCGLTMLLPHGYEGQGPEHSSARLERYLQLCAEHNIQVAVPTTPAQIYHLLRRQVIRPLRKPLIVLTPKSLLRHKLAISTLEDLAEGSFQTVIPEIDALDAAKGERVWSCAVARSTTTCWKNAVPKAAKISPSCVSSSCIRSRKTT